MGIVETIDTRQSSVLSRQQIEEMKAAMPGCRFTYEVRITSDDIWSAVEEFAAIFSETGFQFQGIRSSGPEMLILRVCDGDVADFRKLESRLAECATHKVAGWTTIVGRKQALAG